MKKLRLYYDKEKAETWLNQMCGQGWAMKKFFLGIWTFEPCEKGEYTYRMDLLQNMEGDKQEFVSFMEEIGVEYVCQWYRWVWLRKKAADGQFEMYSDVESLERHYTRILKFFMLGFILELISGFVELSTFTTEINGINSVAAFVVFLLAGVFLINILKYNKKIKRLRVQ